MHARPAAFRSKPQNSLVGELVNLAITLCSGHVIQHSTPLSREKHQFWNIIKECDGRQSTSDIIDSAIRVQLWSICVVVLLTTQDGPFFRHCCRPRARSPFASVRPSVRPPVSEKELDLLLPKIFRIFHWTHLPRIACLIQGW